MRVRLIPCAVAVLVLAGASHGADPSSGGNGSGQGRRWTKKPVKRLTPRVPRKDVEDVERFVEANPDAALDMSHLRSLDAELAEALICQDEEPRSVTRMQKMRYQVAVPVTVDGEPSEKLEARERVIEHTVRIRGKPLYLNGLESLSPETASVLALHTGDLHLNKLKTLPPDVAAEFGGGGSVCSLLSLDGVETVDEESAVFLGAALRVVSLRGVKRLSVQAYDALVQWDDVLDAERDAGQDASEHDCKPTVWLSSDVIIEKRLGHGTLIALRDMAPKGALANYLEHLSRMSGTAIVVDEEASKALGTDAAKTISIEEWRAVAFHSPPLLRTVAPLWASPHNTHAVFAGGMAWGGDQSFPVEQVVDLLLNMIDKRGSGLVVLSGEAGLLVTTQEAINATQREGKSVTLEADEVRVRLPSGEQAFMKRVGGTFARGSGKGGGAAF